MVRARRLQPACFWRHLRSLVHRARDIVSASLLGPAKCAFGSGPRVAHPSGWVFGAPPPESCVHADCSPIVFGGAFVDWSIEKGTLFRRPCSGLQNVLLVVAPVWPTLLAGSMEHPLRNGACTPIAARLFFVGSRFDWSIEPRRLFRRPGPGLENVWLVVAPVWPTLLAGSVGHPLLDGACSLISALRFLSASSVL